MQCLDDRSLMLGQEWVVTMAYIGTNLKCLGSVYIRGLIKIG